MGHNITPTVLKKKITQVSLRTNKYGVSVEVDYIYKEGCKKCKSRDDITQAIKRFDKSEKAEELYNSIRARFLP